MTYLKFYGLGINNNYQANVKIYDNDNLIYDTYTYDGYLCVNLKPKRYKVIATFMGNSISKCIYPNNNVIPFFFNHSILDNNINTITFILKDYYYDLFIEKGVLILNG